jgi:diguanylate cyclase (GGDEF)-like protein/PAS domain S-box-containing protein
MPRVITRDAPSLSLLALASMATVAAGWALLQNADHLLPAFATASHAHLQSSHNPGLVILSVLISVFASYTALDLTGRARASKGGKRAIWLAASAVAMGGGIWSMHFVAMLAFHLGMPISYDVWLTFLSFVVAVAVTGVGLSTVIHGSGRLTSLLLGGIFMGIGVASMHYTGMAAMRMQASIAYEPFLFVLSVLIAIVASVVALWLAFHLRAFWQKAAAAGVLGAAVCGMHYTAMAAAIYTPIAMAPMVADPGIPPELLAIATAGSSFTLLSFGLICSLADQHFATQAAQASLRESEERFRRLSDATVEGILIYEDGKILDANQSLANTFGVDLAKVAGTGLLELLAPESREAAMRNLVTGLAESHEAIGLRRDGSRFPIELHPKPLPYQGRRVQVVAVRDLTERKWAEAQIRYLAHHDALTTLPNRVLFRDRLEQALARARRDGEMVAVLCLDLDRFKEVNDTLGHPAGDGLLKGVAARLSDCVRETDTVARLGGDEFAIVQVGLAQPEGAAALARRFLESLSTPFELGEHRALTGASLGIAVAPTDGDDPDRLLKNSDIALYRAKAESRGTYRFFEEDMNIRLQARRALEQDLHRALAEGQFELHYQPLVDLGDGRLVGFEALLRWRHPEREVGPAEFIPVAEESGLILSLGEWVLRQACTEAAGWSQPLNVAVNLSPAQFKHRDLAGSVADVLQQTQLDPDRLELEITESIILQDAEATLATLRRLKEMGVHISMDDFGTGYSSLSFLRRFPFDKIKIDQSFISGLENSEGDAAIIRAVIALARSLGMTATAEGVETEHQLTYLRNEDCNQAQGYYLGRPAPADEITRMLERDQALSLCPRPAPARSPKPSGTSASEVG